MGSAGSRRAGPPKRPASLGLVRLVYVSAEARPLGLEDLAGIADVSRRNNAALGLTGILLYGSGRFCAVLEGSQRRVFARMERIITDPRHRDARIIREDRIASQRFANWSFGRLGDSAPGGGSAASLESFILGLAARL